MSYYCSLKSGHFLLYFDMLLSCLDMAWPMLLLSRRVGFSGTFALWLPFPRLWVDWEPSLYPSGRSRLAPVACVIPRDCFFPFLFGFPCVFNGPKPEQFDSH